MIGSVPVSAVLVLLAQLVSSHAPTSGLAATPAPAFPVTSGGGLTWAVPKTWVPGPSSAMRLATYFLPAVAGDVEKPELAVFWFGPGQGGSVDANVERWLSQFAPTPGYPKPTRSLTRIGPLPVTLVTAAGTYSSGIGMGPAPPPKNGFALRGAIAEGPDGAVFFKLTGPRRSVAAADRAFDALVASLKP